jgi:hypothetical protein
VRSARAAAGEKSQSVAAGRRTNGAGDAPPAARKRTKVE